MTALRLPASTLFFLQEGVPMKHFALAVLILLSVAAAAGADENLAKNGNFDKGKFGWDFSPGCRILDENLPGQPEPNRILEISAHKTERRKVFQKIKVPKDATALDVAYRLKVSADASPVTRVTLRYEREDGGATFNTREFKAGVDWTAQKWDMTDFQNSRVIVFVLEVHPGAGKVWIDDIVITEKK